MQSVRAKFSKYTNNSYNSTRNKQNQPDPKMGRRLKQTFLQRNTDGQQACEKMLNMANYQRNANQNENKVPPHTTQNGRH